MVALDGQLRIWDYRGARPRMELTAHATTVSSLDWDPTVSQAAQ